MDSATLIRRSRVRAGLSQRALAARARTSAAAICLYESGDRIPRVDTLARLIAAAGSVLVLDARPDAPLDPARNGDILVEVLKLAEELPFHRETEMTGRAFAELAK